VLLHQRFHHQLQVRKQLQIIHHQQLVLLQERQTVHHQQQVLLQELQTVHPQPLELVIQSHLVLLVLEPWQHRNHRIHLVQVLLLLQIHLLLVHQSLLVQQQEHQSHLELVQAIYLQRRTPWSKSMDVVVDRCDVR
jgi:hypothetical protein